MTHRLHGRTTIAASAAFGLLLSACATTTAERAPDGTAARGTTPGGATTREPAPAGGETAALAAAFRSMFADNASALKAAAATYCVGIGTPGSIADPDPELMAALADVRPAVAPASACTVGERVVDARGRPSLLFNLKTVECVGLDNCLFQGGYYEGNLSASSGRYRARFVDGAWQVAPEGLQAIS